MFFEYFTILYILTKFYYQYYIIFIYYFELMLFTYYFTHYIIIDFTIKNLQV
jgi:hypothetical protein